MAKTPAHLLDALDLVTASQPGPAGLGNGLGCTEALHVRRARDVFEGRNVVAIGIRREDHQERGDGALSLCFYVEKKIPKSKTLMLGVVPRPRRRGV